MMKWLYKKFDYKRSSPVESVYLHHIGKTGGVSLEQQVSGLFTPRERYKHQAVTRELLENKEIRFISGHMPWQVSDLLPGPVLKVVFVRDPVEHFLSTFKHLQRRPNHILLRSVAGISPGFSLGEFLQDEGLKIYTTNMQSVTLAKHLGNANRFLSGLISIDSVDWYSHRDDNKFFFECLYGSSSMPREGDELLRKAIARLDENLVSTLWSKPTDFQSVLL